ncbi:hypothetical protein BELL_0150g00140 [Botrytis elliptica]|uniref:Uncharacterized protein n=1 Tax=Botrytis elliptica TaxID=278938 RepID=A0A4Z1K5B4_9HELO|nr:hypothetical protein BELL_0150g00140 [Botrytis elliptica]
MNEQNKPLLTIHDLLARVAPQLQRTDLPITIRILTYVAAGRGLMAQLYIDGPVKCLTMLGGVGLGPVKPYFWRFMHAMVCIPILFLPTSLTQDWEKSLYISSWIITATALPGVVSYIWFSWKKLEGELENLIESHAVQD